MVEVVATEEFQCWLDGVDDAAGEAVLRVVKLLHEHGVRLGFPHSSAIEGSKYAIRELRVQATGRPLRVFYAFDPARRAVLLLGGDKTGDARFYRRMIRAAEKIWKEYLEG
jgi:hypothetical protein